MEPTGEFDPADPVQLDKLVAAAARPLSLQLHWLSPDHRQEALEAGRSAAIEAAMRYRASTARTSKWKNAANAANYAIKQYIEWRPKTSTGADQPVVPRRASGEPDDDEEHAVSALDHKVAQDFASEELREEYAPSVIAFAESQKISLDEADRILDEEGEAAEERFVEADNRYHRRLARLRRSLAPVDQFLLETVLRRDDLRVPQPTAAELAAQTGLTEANVRQRRSRLQKLVTGLRSEDAAALAQLDRLTRRKS